jgi:hypothetical protein
MSKQIQKQKREMDDPQTYASMLMRRLGMSRDRTAFHDAEDVILEAMNEALNHAKQAATDNPKWAAEAIEAIKLRLNNPK